MTENFDRLPEVPGKTEHFEDGLPRQSEDWLAMTGNFDTRLFDALFSREGTSLPAVLRISQSPRGGFPLRLLCIFDRLV